MKKGIIMLALLLPAALASIAQTCTPVDAGSKVKFSIRNLGLNANGSFTGLAGSIKFDPSNLAVSRLEVSVDANSINTGIDARDNHLKKEDYFHVKKYPKISFISDHVTRSANGAFILHGKLTIKGVTKEVSFPFEASTQKEGYVFTGEFKLNRRDFNIGKSSLVLSDNLNVVLSVVCRKS
ncbi:MAG TPA: YceI family protein [Chitinophagaceae bacterium]